MKYETLMIVTRRCDAAGWNASEFFVLWSQNSTCHNSHSVCVSACARVARWTLVERA